MSVVHGACHYGRVFNVVVLDTPVCYPVMAYALCWPHIMSSFGTFMTCAPEVSVRGSFSALVLR